MGVGQRISSDSLPPPAAFLGSLELAGQAHQKGPKSWPLGPCKQASVTQRAGLVTQAKGSLGRLLGWNPHWTLGTLRSRNEPKGKGSTVQFWCHRAGPSSPTFSRLLQPKPRCHPAFKGQNLCLYEHNIVTVKSCSKALPKTVAGLSPACLGALALGGSRYTGVEVNEERGQVILATPKACPRVRGPALQDPLSASSLTRSPQGICVARLRA